MQAYIAASIRSADEKWVQNTDGFKGFREDEMQFLKYVNWPKALISKLPSFGFYPLCSFISNFLSDLSIAAVVDGHCSSPKPINSGVPQDSVPLPTLSIPIIHQ